jgi:hypothetical protein
MRYFAHISSEFFFHLRCFKWWRFFCKFRFLPIQYQHNHNIWHFFSHIKRNEERNKKNPSECAHTRRQQQQQQASKGKSVGGWVDNRMRVWVHARWLQKLKIREKIRAPFIQIYRKSWRGFVAGGGWNHAIYSSYVGYNSFREGIITEAIFFLLLPSPSSRGWESLFFCFLFRTFSIGVNIGEVGGGWFFSTIESLAYPCQYRFCC